MANNRIWTFAFGLLCLSVLSPLTQQASLRQDDYYTAGVVEFRPAAAVVGTPLQQVEDNLRDYLAIINSTAAQLTDIIVFPEGTLNSNEASTYVPDPATFTTSLCTAAAAERALYHDFLVQLSCQARAVAKYVVVNLSEKEICSANAAIDPRPCAANDLNIYNTNVVFDRSGRVISRYRKVHLYGEPKNTTYAPDYGHFETDFGVRFGHFVCFDILFYTPAQEMVEQYGIRDFLFPTMWFSQLPFLTAVQAQFAWAYANDVNFLAAGASRPAVGNTGTGIYHGRSGALVQVMAQGVGLRQLYVAKVPKLAPRANQQQRKRREVSGPVPAPRLTTTHDIYLKRDYLQQYNSFAVDLRAADANGNGVLTRSHICDGKFCCNFALRWHQLTSAAPGSRYYTYRLGAFAGLRNEQGAETNVLRNCAIFACIGPDIMDCGKTFVDAADEHGADLLVQPQIAFESIEIVADFPDAAQLLLQPNSLKDNLLPLQVGEFDWRVSALKKAETECVTHQVRYTLNTTIDDLFAFSIYGNYYDDIDICTDVAPTPKPEDDGANTSALSAALLWTLLTCLWAAT